MAKKLTRGHQKVPIVEMEKNNNLHVTFSKRRNGLFMKANELCTLTGAEVGLLVFSPGERAYSFGHSFFESVIDKFVGNKPSPSVHCGTNHHVGNHHGDNIYELDNQIIDLKKQLKANTKREEVLGQMMIKEGQHKNWWQVPIGEMNLEQLLMMKKALEELKKKVQDELKRQI